MNTINRVLLGIVFTFSMSVACAELKIAVVDMQQLVQASPKFIAATNQLKKDFDPQQTQLQTAGKKLQAEMDDLNRNKSVMTAQQVQAAQDKIVADQNYLQNFQMQLQQSIQAEQQRLMRELNNDFYLAVQKIAKQGNYDLVFQKDQVAYAKDAMDITPQVIKLLK